MMCRVSVVIPCFNGGEHLCEAVESALAQSHRDLEVIVVDDGSTDPATIDLLRTANWPRTRIIHRENGGPSAARNTGVAAATGKYILPLDADDKIAETYVERALAAIRSRPDVGIVYCKAMKFGAESGPWQLPAYTLRELVIDNVIFVTGLYRKSDWELVNGYDERLRHGVEDYEFWVKLVSLGREVIQLDDFLFHYRVQAQSRTTAFASNRTEIVNTYAKIFRGNMGFYAKNAEMLFEHRFGLYDELAMYRERYGKLERLVVKYPGLKVAGRIAKWLIGRIP